MSSKNVDDYLKEGMYGVQLPKETERIQFLGTLRERIVLALTIGQVMKDSGIEKLEEAIRENPEAKLLINGRVPSRYLAAEKALAKKYSISYTTITNNEAETDIGAVLTYDHAIDKEDIYIHEETQPKNEQETDEKKSFLSRFKEMFR